MQMCTYVHPCMKMELFTTCAVHIYLFTTCAVHIYLFTTCAVHIYLFTTCAVHIYLTMHTCAFIYECKHAINESAQEWRNRTLISHELPACSKTCFSKTESSQ